MPAMLADVHTSDRWCPPNPDKPLVTVIRSGMLISICKRWLVGEGVCAGGPPPHPPILMSFHYTPPPPTHEGPLQLQQTQGKGAGQKWVMHEMTRTGRHPTPPHPTRRGAGQGQGQGQGQRGPCPRPRHPRHRHPPAPCPPAIRSGTGAPDVPPPGVSGPGDRMLQSYYSVRRGY